MGRLENARGKCISLQRVHVVGRSRQAQLRLENAAVSSQHARISHSGGRWVVRDLGSRNGTFLNGERLGAKERRPLGAGDCLQFGCPEERWWLKDDAPPCPAATDGTSLIEGEHGLLLLPDAERPEVCVALQDGSWTMERHGEWQPVKDGQRVRIGGRIWTLSLPQFDVAATETTAASSELLLENVVLEFRVAAKGESVKLAVRSDDGTVVLGEYASHRLLLLLAQARLTDQAAGFDEWSAGFRRRDEICSELAMSPERLNVDVHRARKQLAEAGIKDAANIVERRASALELRLGTDRVVILPQAGLRAD